MTSPIRPRATPFGLTSTNVRSSHIAASSCIATGGGHAPPSSSAQQSGGRGRRIKTIAPGDRVASYLRLGRPPRPALFDRGRRPPGPQVVSAVRADLPPVLQHGGRTMGRRCAAVAAAWGRRGSRRVRVPRSRDRRAARAAPAPWPASPARVRARRPGTRPAAGWRRSGCRCTGSTSERSTATPDDQLVVDALARVLERPEDQHQPEDHAQNRAE